MNHFAIYIKFPHKGGIRIKLWKIETFATMANLNVAMLLACNIDAFVEPI